MAERCLFEIARFVDPDEDPEGEDYVRFDFLALGDIGEGFDPGPSPVTRNLLSQEGVDGFVLASTQRLEAIMVVPWLVPLQASWDVLRDAFAALAVELDRPENVFEFMFTDDPAGSYLADTLRAEIPSIVAGPAPQTPHLPATLQPLVLAIPRVVPLRGAGPYV